MKLKVKILFFLLIFLFLPVIAGTEEKHIIYGVPFEMQAPGSTDCGPACLTMMLRYWNENTDIIQSEIIKEVHSSIFPGTFPSSIEKYLKKRGYIIEKQRGIEDLEAIKDYVRRDIPVLVVNRMTSMDNSGHFRVVIGYDDIKEELITHDPSLGITYTMTYTEFSENWNFYKYYMMVFYPPDYEKILASKDRTISYPERSPDVNAKVHLVFGRDYLNSSYYQEAIEETEEGLHIVQDELLEWNLIYIKSEALIELNNIEEAEKIIFEKDPENIEYNPYACYILGRINFIKKNYEKGEYFAKIAVKNLPKFPEAWLFLGKCQVKTGHKESAKMSFQKALELDLNLLEAFEEMQKIEEK